jgi:transcriptional regulator with XRE-family HTH domain
MSVLKKYLRSTDQSLRSFSKRVETSENYLSEISRGIRLPSLTLAYKIKTVSDGAVPMESYFETEEDTGSEPSKSAQPTTKATDGGET